MIEDNGIFRIIKLALFNEGKPEDITITRETLNEMMEQAIVALPVNILDSFDMSDDIRSDWNNAIVTLQTMYVKVMHEQQQLVNMLTEHCIKYVILKGSSAAMYYPIPESRSFGDVDILVKPEDWDKAYQLMKNTGYKEKDVDNSRHAGFEKKGVEFELHRHFSLNMPQKQAEFLDDMLFNSIDRVEMHTVGRYSWYSCPTLENGIVLLHHIRHHLISGLGVRHLVDWMMFVNTTLTDDLWLEFEQLAEGCGNKTLAITVTRMCEMYLGLPETHSWCNDADEDSCRALMEFVMTRGNMGRKRNERSSKVISSLNQSGAIGRLAYEQSAGLFHWKAARHHKILRPFAWIYGIGHHVKKLLTDKSIRRTFTNQIKESKIQQDMIKRLIDD